MDLARKVLLISLSLLVLVVGAGCGLGDKGALPQSRNTELFQDPKKFEGREVTLSGQVLSMPHQVTENGQTVYGFRILCEEGREYQAVIYADEGTVERFDKVTVVGTVYDSEEADTDDGQVRLPLLYPSEVTVTDDSYRTAKLEADHEALVAKQQEVTREAAAVKAKLDAGETVEESETKALEAKKKEYDVQKQAYDERIERIEYLADK